MGRISAVIVDNEQFTVRTVATQLKAHQEFNLLSICCNSEDVLNVINTYSPDVIFIDIAMPGLNGLDILEVLQLSSTLSPLIVCVTALKECAAKAFDYQVLDYMLKPFPTKRLLCCLDKVRFAYEQKQLKQQHNQLDSLLTRKTGKSLTGFMHTLEQPGQISSDQLNATIAVKSGTEWLRIRLQEILWIEAAGDYVCVHTDKENFIVRSSLTKLHSELCPKKFVRFNRSSVVNSEKVVRLTPNSNGEYTAKLENGANVKVSRRYKLGIAELS